MQERAPTPPVRPGRPALGIYVDNVYSIGLCVGDSFKIVASFVEEGSQRSLRTHWKCGDSTDATLLGLTD